MSCNKKQNHQNSLFLVISVFMLYISILPLVNADSGGTYSLYDADRDGFLNSAEFEKFAEKKRKRSRSPELWDFDNVDLDGDNKISEQEMVDALMEDLRRKKQER